MTWAVKGIDDKYHFGGLVGRDAFGAVYHAEEKRDRRELVVRVLEIPPEREAVADVVLARFEREGRRLLELSHSGLAQVVDVGVADGTAYIVSEHVRGKTLGEVLEGGALGGEDFRAVARELLSALSELHTAGIAHGNLTPDTIVFEGGKLGAPKILNVGVAAWVRKGDIRTSPDPVLSSPRYSAPEQFRSDPTPASDVYVLGLLLWEMLTGRPLVDAQAREACMDAHLGSERWRIPADIEIADDLREAIEAALRRHPRKRLPDASEFLAALDEPVSRSEPEDQPAEPRFAQVPEEGVGDPDDDEWQNLDYRSEGGFEFDSMPFNEDSHAMIDPNVEGESEPELLGNAISEVEIVQLRESGQLAAAKPAAADPSEVELDKARYEPELELAEEARSGRRPGRRNLPVAAGEPEPVSVVPWVIGAIVFAALLFGVYYWRSGAF